jgi:hypothetical protein
MKTWRFWGGVVVLVLAVGCSTRPEAIDWHVVEKKLPYRDSQDPSRHGVLMFAYPGYPRDKTPTVIKDYLVELRAYTNGGELYDQVGRPIRFLPPHPRPCGDKWTPEDHRQSAEDYDRRRAELDKQYHVIVIEHRRCMD